MDFPVSAAKKTGLYHIPVCLLKLPSLFCSAAGFAKHILFVQKLCKICTVQLLLILFLCFVELLQQKIKLIIF